MKIKAKDIKLVSISKIKKHPKNRNIHTDEQIDRLCEIIRYSGFRNPLVISNLSGRLIAGHARLKAAKKLGLKEVPVIYQDFDNEEMEYQHLTADNAIAVWADLDKKLVGEDILDFGPDFDTALLGFDNFEIEPADLYADKDEDAVPEPPKEPITKTGDLWILGEHRVLCGDCTDPNNIEKLMNGENADMVFTDPPYGIDVAGSDGKIGEGKKCISKQYGDVIGDTSEFDPRFLLGLSGEKMIFGGNYFAHTLPRSTHWVVWNKHSQDKHLRVNDFSDCELLWTTFKRTSTVMYKHGWSGMFMSGTRRDEGNKKVHPTQKPVTLCAEILSDYSRENTIILDPFLGSGSTLIACEKTNRKCYGMEIDPTYCDVIVKRWETFTGKKATLDA